MVDVGSKDVTERRAVARALVRVSPSTAAAVAAGDAPKGDVIGVARIAGIQAAKRTSELIPLCHGLALTSVAIDFEIGEDRVHIAARAHTVDRTGVEMEALTAVTVSALTIYDMCKAVDRGMRITDVHLTLKSGGKSGRYEAE
jgi:cyclic pyranopterin phosphate synthase